MAGKSILITGSTDGIGELTAHMLAERGYRVLIHGRNRQKAERVAREIQERTGNSGTEVYIADFSSLDNVRRLADELLVRHDKLDVLVNNAGIGYGRQRQTGKEGYELRFTVNYLAPFLLTHRLLPVLRNAAPSRIVNVSSAGQQPIDFDDVMLEQHYSSQRAYNQSKLALVMFTIQMAEQVQDDNITVNSLHPGTYLNTKMVRNAGIKPLGEANSGAEAVVHLATAPELDKVTGTYFDRKRKARALDQAYDSNARSRLWQLSREYTSLN